MSAAGSMMVKVAIPEERSRARRQLLEAMSVIVGLLVAAATAASLVNIALAISLAKWEFAAFLWVATFTVALAHALILGLPIFLALRWLGRLRWWTSLVCGCLVGAMPYAIVLFPPAQGVSSSQLGSQTLPRASVATADAWWSYAQAVIFLSGLGVAGGFAAWLVWYWIGRGFDCPK
jgi:hypothetical protein